MENHKRILGIIYIISAALQVLLLVFLGLFLSAIFGFVKSEADPETQRILDIISSLLQYLPAILITFMSLPSLIAGIGLLNRQSWAMVLALILGCFKLFSFPIGTAIGVYTIWVYAEDQRLTKQA